MKLDNHSQELNKFYDLQKKLKMHHPFYNEMNDEHGFYLSEEKNKINFLITGLTHGDEVIGLQIINLLLENIMLHKNFNLNIGFLLNNVAAYQQKSRFIESDLNRAFLVNNTTTKEHRRASKIQSLIKGLEIKVILDLHQTVEPTQKCFSILSEQQDLISLSHQISRDTEIICFSPKGFSTEGKTLIEFAGTLKIQALVFEIGHKGFDLSLAEKFKNDILNFAPMKNSQYPKTSLEYFFISHSVPNVNDYKLVKNLNNFEKIFKNQCLARNSKGEDFLSPADGYLIFPRYTNIQKTEDNIGLIAVKRTLI